MISYIRGVLAHIEESFIIVEAGGIGYQIFVSPATIASLPAGGREVKIFTYMNVKEDGVSLFGFASNEELDIFHKLITVSGVGPKGALGIVAALSPAELMFAVVSDDAVTLSKAPGIGKKTAQRIILELKDKFKTEDVIGGSYFKDSPDAAKLSGDTRLETVEALVALGYSRSEAAKAVSGVYQENLETEELLKLALKKMVKF